MDELESVYADLYDGSSYPSDSATSMFLDNSRGFPALTDDSRKICEGKLGYSECFSVLGTFPLLGKIQIIKTFAIPKLMFRASVIPISNDLVKEANLIFYNFIWNGKDKVKRCALISDIDKAG